MRGQAGLNAGPGEILSVGAERPHHRSTKIAGLMRGCLRGPCQVWAICQGWCAVERDRQIRKALELLAPPPRERAECENDVSRALDSVEDGAAIARSFRVAGSTKGKAGVMRYCAALQRLRNTYNSLDPAIKPWFSLAERAYVAGNATVIDREIARTESFSTGRHCLRGVMPAGIRSQWRRRTTCSSGGATRPPSRAAGSGRS